MRIALLSLILLAGCRWTNEAAEVAYQETSPEALLRKYTWFKDTASQLDAKKANIEVYKSSLTTMEATYKDTPRASWPRPDLEQYNLWSSEVAGVIASYNSLAAEYNAQMAKANWAFTNVGDLPAGATEPLPRDFAAYKVN
jgi:hypothetical protein